MPGGGIPEEVRRFIFEHLDSAEQLEVLLLLRSQIDQKWTAKAISSALRTTEASAENRLNSLRSLELVECFEDGSVQFRPKTQQAVALIDALAEAYRVRKHKVYELIFSPMKRARSFADAFVVRSPTKDGRDDNS